ncbi:conserved hypothetical protein [Candidatus Sulfopaludibacter sp. SbA4]|nr:conserved hypothetical protein [Candidatus Sulfopaludibacter sp. SbA4]
MKQNITLALDKETMKKVRAFAAQRGTSVRALLAAELRRMVEEEARYEQAKKKALAHLDSLFPLGGEKLTVRESLHDRRGLH